MCEKKEVEMIGIKIMNASVEEEREKMQCASLQRVSWSFHPRYFEEGL